MFGFDCGNCLPSLFFALKCLACKSLFLQSVAHLCVVCWTHGAAVVALGAAVAVDAASVTVLNLHFLQLILRFA